LAGQDPVALDYWAAKNILYPIDGNERHHPDFPGIDRWLRGARAFINGNGGLYRPEQGIFIDGATKNEWEMNVHQLNTSLFILEKRREFEEKAQSKRGEIIK